MKQLYLIPLNLKIYYLSIEFRIQEKGLNTWDMNRLISFCFNAFIHLY